MEIFRGYFSAPYSLKGSELNRAIQRGHLVLVRAETEQYREDTLCKYGVLWSNTANHADPSVRDLGE